MAQKIESYRSSVLRDVLTSFFLDQTAMLPDEWRAYAWIYPYRPQVVIDGAVIGNVSGSNPPMLFGEMKFYPLAVLFSEGDFDCKSYAVTRIDSLLSSNIDDAVTLNIGISGVPPHPWPEAPVDQGSVILHGDGSNYALPRWP